MSKYQIVIQIVGKGGASFYVDDLAGPKIWARTQAALGEAINCALNFEKSGVSISTPWDPEGETHE